jgi:hypothetical protein
MAISPSICSINLSRREAHASRSSSEGIKMGSVKPAVLNSTGTSGFFSAGIGWISTGLKESVWLNDRNIIAGIITRNAKRRFFMINVFMDEQVYNLVIIDEKTASL